MRRQLTAAFATLVLAASPLWAANGNIGLFFDEGAALCQYTVPCQGTATIYVYGFLQGATASGITGAEYRVTLTGTGAGNFFFTEHFNPTSTVLGAGAFPPGGGGVNVVWPSCQNGDGTKVLLETVDVVNLPPCTTTELRMNVVKKDIPANIYFQCPLFTGCDQDFTKYCLGSNIVTGAADGFCNTASEAGCCVQTAPNTVEPATCSSSGQAYLNPGPTRNCTVGVQPSTWSKVKQIYNN